ncbi:MAG: hypothetical protein GX351_11810 [Peptococcaceae bacterium]|nr:hypothetical protein [Peptococcaceae bacterium]
MKKEKNFFGTIGILLFSAILVIGGALGVSSAMAGTAAAEERKIITDDTLILGSIIEQLTRKDLLENPPYIIIDEGNSGDKTSAKDISKEKAVSYVADKIIQLFGDNLEDSRAYVNFNKSYSKVILKDVWVVFFDTADGNKHYWGSVDSVTGQVYDITLYDNSQDPLNFGVEPEEMTPEQILAFQEASGKQQAQKEIIAQDNRSFITAAKDIVSAKLASGRNIVSAEFYSFGSVNSRLVVVVALAISDGSGYTVQLDGFTHELVDYHFWPEGVKEAR